MLVCHWKMQGCSVETVQCEWSSVLVALREPSNCCKNDSTDEVLCVRLRTLCLVPAAGALTGLQGTGKGYKERPTAVYGLVWNPFAGDDAVEFYTYGVKHLKHWEQVRLLPPAPERALAGPPSRRKRTGELSSRDSKIRWFEPRHDGHACSSKRVHA